MKEHNANKLTARLMMALRLLFHRGEYIIVIKYKKRKPDHNMICATTAERGLLTYTYGCLLPHLIGSKIIEETTERSIKFEAEQDEFLNAAKEIIKKG